ncbi:glycosyltransferase family 2 protein [Cyanobium sp. HWJ4-Hawea]|uniref:glycosyltransferase family 2 protein n=1 Tax=Cyanobium sp. HWJ4-Hawea TaxID=2823713 RepID=UPI0020CE5B64|nr:glycosyltransferase family 2 protein [Cyanobium sp. HWJ4-Hawea]MCP9810105.1 glycosyltransferase family 2 protein [Cyanobium sp. HWJ4-Hawea]
MKRIIYFITVNFHCAELIAELITALDLNEEADCSLIIVNNSPEDTSIEPLSADPRITLLQTAQNLGFGSGCNLGLTYVYKRDHNALAWLINPDARLLPEAVSYVRTCLNNDPEIAILGTRIKDMNGEQWFSHGSFNPWTGSINDRFGNDVIEQTPIAVHPSRWLSGCSMVFNLASFDHCPQFDSQYFLYYEDTDICNRYHRLGYRLRVTQATLVEHKVSAVIKRAPRAKYRHSTFSKLYFLHRHATPLALGLNLIYFALRPLTFLQKDLAKAKGTWSGLLDYAIWVYRRMRRDVAIYHPRTSFTATT